MDHIDHVLIVDDDRDIRELVSGYLKRNGLRVTLAADGRQMRSFLERDRVDFVVLDIMMPGDDGLVLCRELRAGRHATTPVLMLTARNDEMDRILGLEMGADDYLAKPFAARELLARIKEILRRARTATSLAPACRACWTWAAAVRRSPAPSTAVPAPDSPWWSRPFRVTARISRPMSRFAMARR